MELFNLEFLLFYFVFNSSVKLRLTFYSRKIVLEEEQQKIRILGGGERGGELKYFSLKLYNSTTLILITRRCYLKVSGELPM